MNGAIPVIKNASSSVPIIKTGDVLFVSVPLDLSDETALELQDELSRKIVAMRAHGVILDISALEIVDSFIARVISTIASMARIWDADTVVSGMRPAVAITLTDLGLKLGGVRTALNAERAFAMLNGNDRGGANGKQ